MENLIAWMAENWLVALTTLVTVCSVIAKVTPNETDNRYVAIMQRIVDTLAMSTGKTEYNGNRIRSAKKRGVKLPIVGVLASLALLAMLSTGCALKGLSPEDKALAVTDEITTAYMSVRSEYLGLLTDLPPDKAAWMVEHIAPILDEGRDALILTREAAATWKAYRVKPYNFDGLVNRVRRLVSDAWAKIAQVTSEGV